MVFIPEHAHRARLGFLVFVLGFGFVLVAPIGLFTVPLAALLLLSPHRSASLVVATSFTGGIGLWWLWSVGDPAEQLVRAGCVMATATFLVVSTTTRWAVIHRALISVVLASIGAAMAVRLLGSTWAEVLWWTEQRAIFVQSYIMQIWLAGQAGSPGVWGGGAGTAAQMENMIRGLPDLSVNLFPATFAIRMVAGLTLATYVVTRIGVPVPGVAVRKFEDFRFSEHLGWPVVFALGIALLVETPALRIPAVNILVVAGVLYGLRGAAIAWFYWNRRSRSRILIGTIAVLAILFLWRIMVPSIIILGLVDTGLDLRKQTRQSKVSQ